MGNQLGLQLCRSRILWPLGRGLQPIQVGQNCSPRSEQFCLCKVLYGLRDSLALSSLLFLCRWRQQSARTPGAFYGPEQVHRKIPVGTDRSSEHCGPQPAPGRGRGALDAGVARAGRRTGRAPFRESQSVARPPPEEGGGGAKPHPARERRHDDRPGALRDAAPEQTVGKSPGRGQAP